MRFDRTIFFRPESLMLVMFYLKVTEVFRLPLGRSSPPNTTPERCKTFYSTVSIGRRLYTQSYSNDVKYPFLVRAMLTLKMFSMYGVLSICLYTIIPKTHF